MLSTFFRLTSALILVVGLRLTGQTQPAITIQVPAGFEVVRIAAPPLISFPILAGFDDRGRLFVAENRGVNLDDKALDEQTPNHVTLLEDIDGDGIFDRSSIFADKMTFPQGALWHQGSLYVASPPSIWRLEDIDDDGKADIRKELVTGYKYTGNAADVHGPFLHPNGRIYWCHGRKGHEVRQTDGTLVAKGLAARIWSMLPDGSDIQVHASGGMDNPAEIAFSQEGDIFGTVNIFLRGPRSDAIVHWVHGGAYPHNQTAIDGLDKTGPLLKAAALIGHVAPAGTVLLRHGTWGELQGNIMWAEFNTRRIMRAGLMPDGATFRAQPEVFATTSADGAHFTDVLEDADGSLIVIDTGAWFRQGCPTSGAARPEIHGGIYRIRRIGATPVVDPRGRHIIWSALSPAAMIEYLDDNRPAVRDRALSELSAKGTSAVESLAGALADKRYLVRSNAVWALTRIGTANALTALRRALADSDPRVRQAACQSAFLTLDSKSSNLLVNLLADTVPSVRRESARALGRLRNASAVEPLVNAATTASNDPVLSHAIIYALLEINNAVATRAMLAHPDPLGRRAALIALDQMPHGVLEPEQVFTSLKSNNAELRAAALQSVLHRPLWKEAVAEHLGWIFGNGWNPDHIDIATSLLSQFLPSPEIRDWLQQHIAVVPPQVVMEAIGATPTVWDNTWRDWLTRGLLSSELPLANAALLAIATHRQHDFADLLRDVARDTSRPRAFRIAALQTAAGTDRTMDPAAFQMVLEPFLTGGSPESRLQTAAIIGSTKLSREQLKKIATLLPSAGPMELPQLLKAFQRAPADSEIGALLLERLQAAPARFGMPSSDLQRVFNRYPQGNEKAAALIAEVIGHVAKKSIRLTELEQLASRGDAARGRKAFEAGAGACVSCHRIGNAGARIGPDLSFIGGIREVRDLVESISFPDASIAQGYEAFNVETKLGEKLAGTISRETSEHVVIATVDGKEITLQRSSVAHIEPRPNSLMPSGLDRAMDPEIFADLVAFLKSLR